MATELLKEENKALLNELKEQKAVAAARRCLNCVADLNLPSTSSSTSKAFNKSNANDLTASIDISVLQERLTNMINLEDCITHDMNTQEKMKNSEVGMDVDEVAVPGKPRSQAGRTGVWACDVLFVTTEIGGNNAAREEEGDDHF
ncbi:Uncharacterized protein Fot_28573 [Forsythia ovata]|uniref:Uncharacterized protein n=1 Tax=Forsythia ovata TaxID=205694 RepID=A0ABD1TPD8_9LAMI